MTILSHVRYVAARVRGYEYLRLAQLDQPARYRVPSRLAHRKIRTVDGERPALERLLGELRPGDVVCDVGANFGLYTVPLAAKLAGSGTVYAFEPAPGWYRELLTNLVLNRLENVQPFRLALGEEASRSRLVHKRRPGSGMGSLVEGYGARIAEHHTAEASVRVCPLDRLVEVGALPSPDILKIDVEGSELAVLRGARRVIRSDRCRNLLVEVHAGRGANLVVKVRSQIEAANLTVREAWPREEELVLLASR